MVASLLGVLILVLTSAVPVQAELLIIANPQAQITALHRQELRAIYLRRQKNWPNGLKIQLTMLDKDGPRHHFCHTYLDKSPSQLERYWRHQLFRGTAAPPLQLATNAAVIDYISATPGALGFIDSNTAPPPVTVLTILP